MGVLTLEQLQDELSEMLGPRGDGQKLGSERLARYVNMAQQELSNSIEFESLIKSDDIATVANDKDYTLATDIDKVWQVLDTDNMVVLSRVPYENYLRYDITDTGQPEIWARAGGLLYLWPTPDSVINIEVWYQSTPTALVADTDVSAFLGVWDQAILLLAGKIGATMNNMPDRAALFLQEARLFIGSRTSDAEADSISEHLGMTVASSFQDITDQRTSTLRQGF